MPFQSVPETVEIDFLYVQNSRTIQMTFYALRPGGYTQSDLDALSSFMDSGVAALWLPIQTVDCTYLRTEVRGLENINDFSSSNGISTAAGGNFDTGLPNQVTYAVQRNSGLTGRSSRGRVFWIGMATTDLSADENFLNAADALAVVAAVENMRLRINSLAWTAVIVSRFTGGVKRPVGETFTWINTLGVDARGDTLRGRLP